MDDHDEENRTELHSGKSEAEVTNNRRLRIAVDALYYWSYLQTDTKHRAASVREQSYLSNYLVHKFGNGRTNGDERPQTLQHIGASHYHKAASPAWKSHEINSPITATTSKSSTPMSAPKSMSNLFFQRLQIMRHVILNHCQQFSQYVSTFNLRVLLALITYCLPCQIPYLGL